MESELNRQRGHHGYEEEPRNAGLHSVEGEGEGEHHQEEKKSVMTKVKDRAKKIKDTIKKHGLGQEPEPDHEHGHNPEEDGEIVDDPQVRGAPMHESSVIKNVDLGQGITPGQKPTDTPKDRFNTNKTSEGFPRPSAPSGIRDEAITRPPGSGGTRDDVGRATAMETDEAITRPSAPGELRDDVGRATARETTQTTNGKVADSPVIGREEANVGQARVKIGQPKELEEDPHSPKNLPGTIPPSNHQSKVVDPTGTGGKEADVAPLARQFDKMNVHDQTDPKSKPESEQRLYTGSHDQFDPQPTPTKDQSTPESNTIRTSTDPSKTEDMPRDTETGKLSYATSAITDRAISAKNMVATKLGYGGYEEGRDYQKPASESTKPVSETASEYVHDGTSTDLSKTEDMPRDTVTGKLSYATTAITDKANSAKNMVTTKLGYVHNVGGQEEGRDSQKPASESTKPVSETASEYVHNVGGQEEGQDSQKPASESMKPVSETASEYVHNVAPTVTEKFAPVNQKVQGSGTREEGGDRAVDVGNEGVAKGTDKGVPVKDYLAEKFRPSDDDKALSESISGALHKKKGETGRTEEGKPMGKVTESEQLATRLGTGAENKREGEDALAAGKESSGTGMVDRIKGAVGSWLGKSDGLQTAQDSLGQAHVSDTATAPTQGNERGQEVSGSRNRNRATD